MRTLNQYLQVEDSPIATINRMSALQSQDTIDLQSSSLKVTNMTFPTLIGRKSAVGTFAVDGSSTYFLHSNIAYKEPHNRDRNFAQIHFCAWDGTSTVGSMMIYPDHGVGVDDDKYTFWANYNANMDASRGNYNGTNSLFTFRIKCESGTAGTISYVTDWRWLQFFNSGAS